MKSRRNVARNFDGTAPTGTAIHSLLPQILHAIGRKVEEPWQAVFQEWTYLAGERFSGRARPVSFADGILTVAVTGSSFLSILQMYERPRILKEMKKKFLIQDIVLKLG